MLECIQNHYFYHYIWIVLARVVGRKKLLLVVLLVHVPVVDLWV